MIVLLNIFRNFSNLIYNSTSASTNAAPSNENRKIEQTNVSILDLDVPESEQNALPDVDEEIKKRLTAMKQPLVPEEIQSDSDIGKRLANLKGVPFKEHNNIDAINKVDKRTEQERSNDLIKQLLDENDIDNSSNAATGTNDIDIDDDPIKSIERRLAALKGPPTTNDENKSQSNDENEDDETVTNKIVKRVKSFKLFVSVLKSLSYIFVYSIWKRLNFPIRN